MQHKYLAPKAPSFRTRITVDEKDVHIVFTNGVYSTEDDKIASTLDAVILSSEALALHIKKVDMAEAEAAVKAHQESLQGQILKGGTHSGALDKLKAGAIPASGNAAEEAAPSNEEALVELQAAMSSEGNIGAGEDVITITEHVDEPTEIAEVVKTAPKPLTF